MRLIALSTQARIKTSSVSLHTYVHEMKQLSERVLSDLTYEPESVVTPPSGNEELIILIGSQKGLCGTFNIQLEYFFEQECLPLKKNTHLIILGKKIVEYAQRKKIPTRMTFPNLMPSKVLSISKELTDHIWHHHPWYSRVSVIFNYIKFGVIPTSQKITLIPLEKNNDHTQRPKEGYYWAQDPHLIMNTIFHNLLIARVQGCLLGSLLAEHMARFVSMHRATKNASDLLDVMHINYNKLRQAKITRELTDLIASF